MELKTLLETLVAGGVGGTVIYALLNQWSWFGTLNPDWKRVVAFAGNALIATLAFLGAIGMGYTIAPVGAQSWIEGVVNIILRVGSTAFVVSQVWHLRDLGK